MTIPCIRAIAYAMAGQLRSVAALAAEGKLESEPSLLERFGFSTVHVATGESPYELAVRAATDLLTAHAIDPDSIDAVVYGGTPSCMAFAPADLAEAGAAGLCTSARFRSPATRLQYELGLQHASVLALDQLACTTLFGAVRVARALCVAEGARRVLCVVSEFYPAAAGREAIYNCTSDAACALLVDGDGERNRLGAAVTVTKGYYWNHDALRDEVVASYFPTAKRVIEQTVRAAGWQAGDVDWVIPHNVSRRSWELLLGLSPLPKARLWAANIARFGHTLAGDNFINLHDALMSGAVCPGDRLLLFAYGYGAHWTALAVEA
jgi:3-oxoacyl-[acyl-carrier-protein] synthase-3